jgi:excisionase family DNA binding protein
MNKYLSVQQFSDQLNFSRFAVYQLIERGKIKAERFGGVMLIPAKELDAVKLVKHGKRFWLERKKS